MKSRNHYVWCGSFLGVAFVAFLIICKDITEKRVLLGFHIALLKIYRFCWQNSLHARGRRFCPAPKASSGKGNYCIFHGGGCSYKIQLASKNLFRKTCSYSGF